MSRSRSRIACALLILVLAAPSWAAPIRGASGAEPLDLLAQLWEAVRGIWSPASDEGCAMDPHGACTSDEGCGMDPHGNCRPPAAAPTSDEGCGIDPHGGCKPGS